MRTIVKQKNVIFNCNQLQQIVKDTSSPTVYQKSQCIRLSRPSSRIDSCSSAKSRASNSSDRLYNAVNNKLYATARCSSARSHSLPIKTIPQRNTSSMPISKQATTTQQYSSSSKGKNCCQHFIKGFSNEDSEKTAIIIDQTSSRNCQHPMPAPRKKNKDGIKRIVEPDYLKFSLRIMEDIIRNNLHSNQQMQNVFKTHLEANAAHLNKEKMLRQIKFLKDELNMPNERDEEYDTNITEVIPPIKFGNGKSSAPLSPNLNCECKVVRKLPMPCPNVSNKNLASNNASIDIDHLLQEEFGTFVPVNPNNVQNIDIANAFHRERNIKNMNQKTINKDCNSVNKKNIEEMTVMYILDNDETTNNKFQNLSLQADSSIANDPSSPNLPKQYLTDEDNDVKGLVLTNSDTIRMQPVNKVTDDYVLIPGPVFVPKTYFNNLTVEEHLAVFTPKTDDGQNMLKLTKNTGVNTDSLEDQVSVSVEACVKTADKSLNTSSPSNSFFSDTVSPQNSSNIKDALPQQVHEVDLDFYDLTPERDDNYKHINPNLLLGDKYELQQNNKDLDVIKTFYPDRATQTTSSETLFNNEQNQLLDLPMVLNTAKQDLHVVRKSTLKAYGSLESPAEEDELKRRTSIKSVSIKETQNHDQIITDLKHSLEATDENKSVHSSNIFNSIPELRPRGTVTNTVKRVTNEWNKIRSENKDIASSSILLEDITATINTNQNVSDTQNPKPKLTPKLSGEISCCGFKFKNPKYRDLSVAEESLEMIPTISKIDGSETSLFIDQLPPSNSPYQTRDINSPYQTRDVNSNDDEKTN